MAESDDSRVFDLLQNAIAPATAPYETKPLTVEMLRAAIEKSGTEWFPPPHGTEARPHIFSPVPESFWYDHCTECGMEMTW